MTKLREVKNPDRQQGVTLTYADCNNRVLHDALEKLDNCSVFNGQDLSRFNKIKGKYDQKSKEVARLFKKLIDKHAAKEPVLDQSGNPVLKPNGQPETRPKMVRTQKGTMDFVFTDKKAFNEDYRLLMSESFKIEVYKLLTEDLVRAGLTPKEIRAAAKIISDIDPELVE